MSLRNFIKGVAQSVCHVRVPKWDVDNDVVIYDNAQVPGVVVDPVVSEHIITPKYSCVLIVDQNYFPS